MSTLLNNQVSSLVGPVPAGGRPGVRTLPHREERVLRRGPARDSRRPGALTAAPRRVVPIARCAPRTAAGSLVWLLLAGGLTLLVVLGIGWLGTGGAAADPVPDTTALVQVQSGDSLTSIAHRMDPNSSSAAVADRIRSLNSLTDAALFPGQLLQVPVGSGATGTLAR
jgi:LysM domain